MINEQILSESARISMLQSLIFSGYMFRYLSDEVVKYPYGSKFTALDVGPGLGSGTNLLGEIFSGREYHIQFDTVDIIDGYKKYLEMQPFIYNKHYGDIFSLKFANTYDFVLCSNVIEHMEDPLSFCIQLSRLGKHILILAPWKENKERMTRGHYFVFDEEFIKEIEQNFGGGGKTLRAA